jgi:hypothetical protein
MHAITDRRSSWNYSIRTVRIALQPAVAEDQEADQQLPSGWTGEVHCFRSDSDKPFSLTTFDSF